MRTRIFLLLALSLPSVIWAQSAKPRSANGSPQAAQPQQGLVESLENDPEYKRLSPERQAWVRAMTTRLETATNQHDIRALEQLKLEVAQRELTGTKFCGGLVVNEGTFVDAFVSKEPYQAFAVRWLDREPGTAVHTAIFTSGGRCVVKDGDVLEGDKSITRILPKLAVSGKYGFVAYEAFFLSPSELAAGSTPHRAVFIENRFLTELDPHKASAPFSLSVNDEELDFRWNDDPVRVELKPGLALLPAAQAPAAAGTKQTTQRPLPAPSKQPANQAAQTGCGSGKSATKKPGFGGIPLPGSIAKVMQKAQQSACAATAEDGQGANH